MKNSTTPKWAKQKNKAARRAARIRTARQWFPTYTGTHLVHAYRQKFKVDVTTAINDLVEIGALTQEQAEEKRRAEQARQEHLRREREAKAQKSVYDRFPDSDDRFFYIAGYTSGGAPYGVTWEEMGLSPWESIVGTQE